MNNFGKWIVDQGGPHPLAKKLKLHDRTVYWWVQGKATPETKTLLKLVKLGAGAFTLSDIVEHTCRNKK